MESGEAGKRRGRRAGKRDKRTDETPRKCTIVLSARHDLKLGAYALIRGINRSAVVAELIEKELGSVVVSIRGPREEPSEEGPREGETAAA